MLYNIIIVWKKYNNQLGFNGKTKKQNITMRNSAELRELNKIWDKL